MPNLCSFCLFACMEHPALPYEVIWESHGVRMQFSSEMSPADILNANFKFYADERSDRARYQILDCLEVTSLCDDPRAYEETMVTLAAMDNGASLSLGPVKVALVAVLPEAIELFGRYSDVSSEIDSDWPTRVFPDLDSARAWIGSTNCS